jgi:hypothetical protein
LGKWHQVETADVDKKYFGRQIFPSLVVWTSICTNYVSCFIKRERERRREGERERKKESEREKRVCERKRLGENFQTVSLQRKCV